ncbi:EfeM/EfeO family lipoprotein [Schinkia azotoformans]|uniref:Lipoprotein n=1 Tax=Schinkia azotoformans LMG 9581 TaxID=1131731 RepID=K6DUY5_SCHAZ|nr:iron uptake system protein EfeO [Schinkia azotoformans]EKN64626.1 lipoprotein precursor [Schinkia azotoformans LMG 9581]MEC1640062.1 EfeM/EfeO family lipoprotein [Schinkia azotoformans]MEC1722621.1 EfeM/EfeO family lipoprotein [Schinkia azotoformans]MEC1943500.1 EfeM/EfeO family lipoprotein [Schinkia azotoformans]MED4354840.1 EfeM/EfeO family lipoprotein [Schinkia azotoformans]
MKKISVTFVILLSSTLLFGCAQSDETVKPSSQEGVKQETTAVTSNPLEEVTKQYREYAIGEIDAFVTATEEFTTAIKNGDLEKAKELYAPSRVHYERAEPIAEVFGDLDPKIDAREGDVPENEWGGYHRLEKGLWIDNTTKGYEDYADQLMKDVHLLRAKVETVEVTPDLLITGAVDLLNEVSTSKVTGEEDRYSHTDLYDFMANVEGAEKIYLLLKPALDVKDADLSKLISDKFSILYRLLAEHKQGDSFVSYTELTKDEVKALSQALDALAEPLSQIGIVVEGV